MADRVADSQGGKRSSLLSVPVDLRPLAGLDISARYHAERSGGDFFDAIAVSERLVFLLTDIAGPKSATDLIAAGLQGVFRQTAMSLFTNAAANESESIASLAHETNRALIDAAGSRLAPAFLACFNLSIGVMTYCNAGRIPAVFRDTEGTRVLEQEGVPFGLFTHVTYEPALLAFQPGDKLLLTTKGVVQSRRGAAEFGTERVEEILKSTNTGSAAEICDAVLQQAYDFGEHPLSQLTKLLPGKRRVHDDLTAVVLIRCAL